MKNNSKRGFNLIEIAIVLAVIGLVIGGIYVAASSVTDNQRKQKAQSQLLTVVQNMRTTFATQTWTTTAPSTQVLVNARVFPADMIFDGTNVAGAYGNVVIAAPSATEFSIAMDGVTRGACIDILSKSFGTATAINQIGLTAASGTAAIADISNGITLASANTACSAETNRVTLTFTIR